MQTKYATELLPVPRTASAQEFAKERRRTLRVLPPEGTAFAQDGDLSPDSDNLRIHTYSMQGLVMFSKIIA